MSGRDFHDDSVETDDGSFDEVISLLRDGPIDLVDEQPSPSLWAGIAAELGLNDSDHASTTAVGGRTGQAPADVAGGSGETDRSQPAVDSTSGDAGESPASNVVSLDSRRRWGRPAAMLTLAAAVVLLLAVPIGLAISSGGDDPELIAAAELELLEGQQGRAVSAEVLSVDGTLVIDVEAPTSVEDGEFLELWLLEVDDEGVAALESLGPVDGSGRYEVPEGVDLDRFSVVDISVEPDDGNPDHSGVSVVRGELA